MLMRHGKFPRRRNVTSPPRLLPASPRSWSFNIGGEDRIVGAPVMGGRSWMGDAFANAVLGRYEPQLVDIAADSPEAMFDLLAQRKLGDGLPVVPPTPERVDAMLNFAAGDPDAVLFTLQPRAGVVTRRVVAVNA